MRELTLLETGYFAGALLLSLILPLLMSFRGPRDIDAKKSCMRTVWIGQGSLTVAGIIILISAPLAAYAAAFGLIGCFGSASVLLRQFRVAVRSSWSLMRH